MLETIILVIISIAIFVILMKTGIFTLTQQSGFKYVKGSRKAKCSYKYFNGIQDIKFHFIPGRPVTLNYEVSVEQGELKIMIGRTFSLEKNVEVIKEFTESATGNIQFTPTKTSYTIRLEGIKTKGSCEIEY